jgi:hypothetical protein
MQLLLTLYSIDGKGMNIKEHWRNDSHKAKLKYKKETCANVIMSNINSTQTALGLNLSLDGMSLGIQL